MTSRDNAPRASETTDRQRLKPTIVYIDGFNVYHAIKHTNLKWLDYRALAALLLPHHQIDTIKYFTARVNLRANDKGAPARQDTYIRALIAHADVEVHEGKFRTSKIRRPLAEETAGIKKGVAVEVLDTREKGSDVSLGSHLVLDACKARMEVALVMSNDSDLQTPVSMAEAEGALVVTVNPSKVSPRPRKRHLKAQGERTLSIARLAQCQLPNPVTARNGMKIAKPRKWS